MLIKVSGGNEGFTGNWPYTKRPPIFKGKFENDTVMHTLFAEEEKWQYLTGEERSIDECMKSYENGTPSCIDMFAYNAYQIDKR